MNKDITQEILANLGLTTPDKVAQYIIKYRFKVSEDGISDVELYRITKEAILSLIESEKQKVVAPLLQALKNIADEIEHRDEAMNIANEAIGNYYKSINK